MRRRLAFLLLLALVLSPAAVAAKKHWAAKEISTVVQRGVLAADVATFRPDDPLKQGELGEALALLELPSAASTTDAPVAMTQLNTQLVRALGLRDTAYRFAQAARAAGLKPTSRFGSEVVARLIGLRTNHPAAADALELGPNQPATRAEAAFSFARILQLDDWALESVKQASQELELPVYEGRAREVLQLATTLVGHPYVWGGTSEKPQVLFGRQVPGGFDCSGFVWRIFKAFPDLARTLRGRTSMAMSGEVPQAQRIGLDALEPADVVFFGTRGTKSKPAQVDHMGIYLGSGWVVHSSGFGVALVRLDGWYAQRFAWARRPLAEAAL